MMKIKKKLKKMNKIMMKIMKINHKIKKKTLVKMSNHQKFKSKMKIRNRKMKNRI